MTKVKKRAVKNLSVKKLKATADKMYSQYVRLRDSDDQGYCRCVTCGKRDHWKHMQAGHYVPRTYLALRWDDVNVNVQCVGCNIFKSGAMDEYAVFLIGRHGAEILGLLSVEKSKLRKMGVADYKDLIDHIGDKLAGLNIVQGELK